MTKAFRKTNRELYDLVDKGLPGWCSCCAEESPTEYLQKLRKELGLIIPCKCKDGRSRPDTAYKGGYCYYCGMDGPRETTAEEHTDEK